MLCVHARKDMNSSSSAHNDRRGMSKLRLLDFQYNLSRGLRPAKPVIRWLSSSANDRQISGLGGPSFQPDRAEMRRVFDKIDADGDGKISRGDLRRLLNALGKDDPEGVKAEKMLWAADVDGDGVVGFTDFMEVHKSVSAGDIRLAFHYLDADGDGRIGAKDLHKVMAGLGETCTAEECRRMVRCVDKTGDGLVDMDDFMAMMTATSMKPIL